MKNEVGGKPFPSYFDVCPVRMLTKRWESIRNFDKKCVPLSAIYVLIMKKADLKMEDCYHIPEEIGEMRSFDDIVRILKTKDL